MDRMGAAGECDSFAALAVIYEDDMRERLGWVLLALAVILLLAGIRLPEKQELVTIVASGPAAEAAPIPVKRGLVPVNTADAALLDTLPGIGEVYAQKIIEEREADGPYFYPEDVMDAWGIGEKRLEAIYDMLDLSSGDDTGG